MQVSEKHVCQARPSRCSPDDQVALFNYYYLSPSRPKSHGLGAASRWRGHAVWNAFLGPGTIPLLWWIISLLIIYALCLCSSSSSGMACSPLLFLCVDFGLPFFCLLVFITWWNFSCLMYLPNSGPPSCLILPTHLLYLTQHNRIQKFITGKGHKCWI